MDLGDSGGHLVIDNREKRTLESEIRIAEASRAERHSEVNYELAAHSRRHSQRSLTF